eukprot:403360940
MGNSRSTSQQPPEKYNQGSDEPLTNNQQEIDLQKLDDFSDEYHKELLKQKKILEVKKFNSKSASMGLPASGIRSIYRNPLDKVLMFFKKFHNNKVKIYNLCDDHFIDTNQLSFSNGEIKVAYFPMMDHNPCQIQQIFNMLLDILLFLIQDEENMVAIHCKAGKGRTGVAISAYLIFMEACTDGYDGVEFFNSRRTKDGKGLGVASQKRYLHYFNQFLKQNFKSPYRQLIVPFLQNPKAFDHLFLPKSRLKLMSLCIGPFKQNPIGINLKVFLRSFENPNLYKSQDKKKVQKQFTEHIIFNKQDENYFILIIFHEEIAITEDICVKIRTSKIKSNCKLTFHYWLNARFVSDGVGKVKIQSFQNKDNITFSDFIVPTQMGRTDNNYQMRPEDEYQLIKPQQFDVKDFDISQEVTDQGQKKNKTKSLNGSPTRKRVQNSTKQVKDVDVFKEIIDFMKLTINKYQQNGQKRIKAKQSLQNLVETKKVETSKSDIQEKDYSSFGNLDSYERKNESFDTQELKRDAKLIKQADISPKSPEENMSDSDDENCIVKDDNEEGMALNTSIRDDKDRGSFKIQKNQYQERKIHQIKRTNNFGITSVSARKQLPRFNNQVYASNNDKRKRSNYAISEVDQESDSDNLLTNRSIKESIFSATEGRKMEDQIQSQQFKSSSQLVIKGQQIQGVQGKGHHIRTSMESFVSPKQNLSSALLDQNPFSTSIHNQSLLLQPQMTAAFNDDDTRTVIRLSELDFSHNKSINYSASDEQDRLSQNKRSLRRAGLQDSEQNLMQQISLINRNQNKKQSQFFQNDQLNDSAADYSGYNSSQLEKKVKNVLDKSYERQSQDINERINELSKNSSLTRFQNINYKNSNQQYLGTYLSQKNLSLLQNNIKNALGLPVQKRQFIPSVNSYKFNKQSNGIGGTLSSLSNQTLDHKKLIHVTLSCEELDKFKEKKLHPDIKVMTTFYQDPALDQIMFKYQNDQNSQVNYKNGMNLPQV